MTPFGDEEPFGHLPDGHDAEVADAGRDEPAARPASPRRASAALAGALTFVGEVLGGRSHREEIPHVIEAAGEPEDEAVDVVLDPDRPAASRATIRPWLIRRR